MNAAWKLGILGALCLGYVLSLTGALQGWDVDTPTKTPKRSVRLASVTRTYSSTRTTSRRRSGFFVGGSSRRSSFSGGGFSFGK